MKTLSILIALSALSIVGCRPPSTQIQGNDSPLDVQTDEESQDASSCVNEEVSLEVCAKEVDALRFRHTSLCDAFESRVKNRYVPTAVTITTKDSFIASPCDEDLQLKIQKLKSNSVWIHYMVDGETRYSPEMYWTGKKGDRSSIMVQGLEHQVLVNIDSCDKTSCDVECVLMKVNDLTCASIIPEL